MKLPKKIRSNVSEIWITSGSLSKSFFIKPERSMYSYSMTLTTVSFETKLIIHAFIYLRWGENKTLHVYENNAKKFLIFRSLAVSFHSDYLPICLDQNSVVRKYLFKIIFWRNSLKDYEPKSILLQLPEENHMPENELCSPIFRYH